MQQSFNFSGGGHDSHSQPQPFLINSRILDQPTPTNPNQPPGVKSIPHLLDLQAISKTMGFHRIGLSAMSKAVLDPSYVKYKSLTVSNWEAEWLTQWQLRCVCRGAGWCVCRGGLLGGGAGGGRTCAFLLGAEGSVYALVNVHACLCVLPIFTESNAIRSQPPPLPRYAALDAFNLQWIYRSLCRTHLAATAAAATATSASAAAASDVPATASAATPPAAAVAAPAALPCCPACRQPLGALVRDEASRADFACAHPGCGAAGLSCWDYMSHLADNGHACTALEAPCADCGRLRRLVGSEAAAAFEGGYLQKWKERQARRLAAQEKWRAAREAAAGKAAAGEGEAGEAAIALGLAVSGELALTVTATDSGTSSGEDVAATVGSEGSGAEE
jgi:hypothetical protein